MPAAGSTTRARPVFIELLAALAAGRRLTLDRPLSVQEIDWLVGVGCAPVFWHAAGGTFSVPAAQSLRAAELTAKVLGSKTLADVEKVIERLAERDIVPTLLKGISYATRYYPEPHLRVMGDVDLLVAGRELARAQRALLEAGFEIPAEVAAIDYSGHHHAPPLYHREHRLWLELHTSLLLPTFTAATEPPFDPPSIAAEQEQSTFRGKSVRRLSRECELAYLAAAWCCDISGGRLTASAPQRQLVDAVLLLRESEGTLDWPRILHWSRRSQTGVCLYLLLSYLARHDALPDPARLTALGAAQAFMSPSGADHAHRLMGKYLAAPGAPGRVITPHVASTMLATLMSPRPSWRSLLRVPFDVLFPPGVPNRFAPRYQLGRLASLLKPRL